jgi:hypothetical protein
VFAAQVFIEVRDNFFNVVSAVPGQGTPHATIQPGDQVVWEWVDSFPHSVTADDESFDSGVRFAPDDWERTFNSAGTFDYHCILHGGHGGLGMSGSITVEDVPPPCPGLRGDANCDGAVNFFDIDPFLVALFDEAAYRQTYCLGNICAADTDCSETMNFFDIDPFLACLFGGCLPCP